ncbi:MAG: hypothetical protein L0271_02325 [Gemmatimonadetes bacterium]|nr:hypothetical protein [Gemmatimonadota bacterium]
MSTVDAFHLPGLRETDVERWRVLERNGVAVRSPVLVPGALRRWIAEMRTARKSIEARPAREIAVTIDRAAARVADEATRGRTLDDLAAITGYSAAMARLVVQRMAEDWRLPALERLLGAELDGGRALDTFVPGPGRSVRSLAVSPPLTVHILAGNVPGVAITSIVRALLVRSAVLAKPAAGEPLLAPLFARTLEQIDPALAGCLRVVYWAGGEDAMEDEALAEADALIVYGNANALHAVRARAPAGVYLIEHGPRFSAGLVSREALRENGGRERVADAVARATVLFDQQGCVSPHAIWVEGGRDEAKALAQSIAESLARLDASWPRGSLDAGAAAAIRDARASAEFRAIAGDDVDVLAPPNEGMGWTVIRESVGAFEPSPLFRTLRVLPIDDLEDAAERLAPWGASLQTIAIAGPPDRVARLASRLARIGAMRITDFERMPWPPVDGHHDGRGPLTELVRWVDHEPLETG